MAIEQKTFPGPQLDPKNFDPKPYYDFIGQVFNSQLKGEADTSYGWGGELEDRRLAFQNSLPGGWAVAHFNYHARLREEGLNPSKIAEIGVGKDATLVRNMMVVHPDAEIIVVELDKSKVEGAIRTLNGEGRDLKNVNFVSGDAAQVLPRLARFDLIDAQLLLQHLGEKAPLAWDEDQRGPFPTLERVIEGVTDSLRPGGLFTASDMAVAEWKVYANKGHETNPETAALLERANKFIQGDGKRPGALALGWAARGSNAWRDADHISNTVHKLSGDELNLIKGGSFERKVEMKNLTKDDPETILAAFIPPTMALAIDGALRGSILALATASGERHAAIEQTIPRLQGAKAFLLNEGSAFVNALRHPGIAHDIPTMHWQAYVRS